MLFNKKISLGLAITSLALLNSCATKEEFRYLQREIHSLQGISETHKNQIAKSGDDYYQSLQKLQVALTDLSTQKKEWYDFQRAYSPKLRRELQDNLNDSEKVLKKLSNIASRCQKLLSQIEKHETSSAELKDKVEQHEKEARKDNVVQQLREERDQMVRNVKNAQKSAQAAERKVKEVQQSVANTEKEVLKAKHSADLAKVHSEKASDKAEKVESFLLEFNKMSREISALQAEVRKLKYSK